jgi:ATP-binding cassette subfamily C (CFTR/MRP) protein 10
MRSCVVTIVYQKSLSMSLKTKNEFSAGEINNLISADCQRIMDFCISFHQVWSLPFQIGCKLFLKDYDLQVFILVALYLLSIQIGSSLFSGLGVILIIIIANMFITKQIAKTSSEMMKRKDVRIELVNEVLKNYKVMKYFAWENL